MVSGAYCNCCSLYSDVKCIKKAEQLFKCKQIFSSNKTGKQDFWPHHWIKGNLKLDSICYICNELTGNQPHLSDYRCCWCQRNVHDKCLYGEDLTTTSKNIITSRCDFGNNSKIILKPNLLVKKSSYFQYNLTLKDFRIDDTSFENWTPLIVFANKKSGNHDAETISITFNSILNPLQV